LAAGPGVNPLGDEALQRLPDWWTSGPCVIPAKGSAQGSGTCAGTNSTA